MVSEWMVNGNINKFVKEHRGLKDVTRGLAYIHDQAMVHGDLKGANILIDQDHHACLVDFGLLTLVSDPTDPTALDSIANDIGNSWWMSPELLRPEEFGFKDCQSTKESDCYALGMVILEVLNGQVPFAHSPGNVAIMEKDIRSRHPKRPEATWMWFTDDLWGVLKQCWSSQPKDRPTVETIFGCLERASLATAVDSSNQLINHSFSQDELPYLLETVLWSWESTHIVQSLQGGDSQVFVDVLDEALGTPLPPGIRKRCLQLLCEMCGCHALSPTSLKIKLDDIQTDGMLYQGGSSNVLKHTHQGQEVAIKTLRISTSIGAITHRFCKEFVLWNALRHPNVLPLVGVILTETEAMMVSKWMPNGNINQFVKENQDVNRFELLSDIVRGLIYMHNKGMIHGDLKGGNILVDQTCHARIADFGLTVLSGLPTSNPCTQRGTTRWMSPELFDPEIQDWCPTKHSDCYALGMVIYEILSLHIPFYQYQDTEIPEKVVRGDHPERPEGEWLADDVWEVLEHCWAPEPQNRLSIEDVLHCLEESSEFWMLPSCGSLHEDSTILMEFTSF
ncbi:kinase-like domain-containing protein [Thelephora terrestris]|uniref:Kinase-like domain-containing protein n=1 Tax=Thelephora terrestris TaxID=56493 RepID=A0A9P6H823_9AGAM|nr:kinase-like domain-containing protein [Thelephora terrestris]